nr:hypothetical protein [Streptomyces tsukubensis NRRL18488]
MGAAGQPVDGGQGDPGEQAFQYGVPPGVRGEVRGGVGAEGGGDEPGVVGTEGVLDERQGGGGLRGVETGQGEEDGAPLVGGAAVVEPGEGGEVGGRGEEEQDAAGVGVLGAEVPSGGGEGELPGGLAS